MEAEKNCAQNFQIFRTAMVNRVALNFKFMNTFEAGQRTYKPVQCTGYDEVPENSHFHVNISASILPKWETICSK